ncbi:MAG: hypothetical protein HQ474_05375 [Flammeovirgaceae bacterium]|nr:hypothetical protein [Flammeovirgaceae bacterium]
MMRKYLLYLVLLLSSFGSLAQKRVQYSAKGKQEVVRKNGESIRYLIDDVVFTQDNTIVYCDSAVYQKRINQMMAYDHVKIINDSTTITSNSLFYEGNERMAQLRGNVLYQRGYQELITENLDYALDTEVAHYFSGGKLIDTTNILSSRLGYFYAQDDLAQFYHSVVLISPEFTLKTDTLRYNTITKVAYSTGPTEIINKDGTLIYANGGEFRTEISQTDIISGNIETPEYLLEGDQLFFDDLKKYYLGKGNVQLTSKDKNIILSGEEGYYDQNKKYSKIYGNAILKKIMELDTFYIAADTMITIESEYDSVRRILAYPDIRIFRTNLQGLADSAAYFISDSVITLFNDPILWTGKSQIFSDTILLFLTENTIERMDLRKNAFLITLDSVDNFNQIKGRTMNVFFQKNNLHHIDINGNCESIFHSMDQSDTLLLGINKMVTSNMTMRFLNNQIDNFTIYKNPEGRFIPPHEITEEDKILDGFNWMIDRRPTLEDIFIKPISIESPDTANLKKKAVELDSEEVLENKKKLQEVKSRSKG